MRKLNLNFLRGLCHMQLLSEVKVEKLPSSGVKDCTFSFTSAELMHALV